MPKTPTDANGGTPTNPSASNGRKPPRDRKHLQSSNMLRPSGPPAREERAGEARSPRSRARDTKRTREDAAPAEERTPRESVSRVTRESQQASINSIRPTRRPVRDKPLPVRELPSDRARRAAGARSGVASPVMPPVDAAERAQDRHAMPEEIKRRFVQVGNKYHFPDGARAFTDHGNRLTSPSENSEVIKSLVSIAQVRGWSDITISGTERFRKEAWFAARLAGLEVRGYSPTEFEQGRLVRTLARAQASSAQPPASGVPRSPPTSRDAVGATGAPNAGDAPAEGRHAPRERQRTLQVGRLVDHGAAPYLHDSHNAMSYFIRIETPAGEREIWGVDLHRALQKSLTRPQIGDEIGVRSLRQDVVKVFRPEHDAEGRVIGEKAHDTHRNAWVVEKREFFRERAQASRVLRDPGINRQQAVKQHPELLGTYLQLHAAELAAKTLRNPEDQRRFVASVRTALADSVARGEPLSPVPLKDTTAQNREPRRPRAAASPERDVAPVR